MDKSNGKARRYKWPWMAAAAVALGIVLSIVWVGLAAHKLEQERQVNGALPDSAPVNTR